MSFQKGPDSTVPKHSRPVGAAEELAAEIASVTDDELVHINIDVVAAVTTALGVLPKLDKLSSNIRSLPTIKEDLIEKFEAYAMALYESHADYLSASKPVESLPALVESGTVLRDRLYTDMQALIVRGFVNGQEVREVRTSTGHKALALDLTLLADAVQRRWHDLEGKTAIQLAEVLEADRLAASLLRAIGEREQTPAAVADASAKRSRAFALFLRAYDEVRRAVTFLRWEQGDAELIAPSLYQARAAGRKKVGAQEPAVSSTETPATAASSATSAALVIPSSPTKPANVGFPESEPFADN